MCNTLERLAFRLIWPLKFDVDSEEIVNNSKDITDSMVLHTTEATEINLMKTPVLNRFWKRKSRTI